MSPNRQAASPKELALTIVLTGGGSGGHIIPVLSLARALKKQKPDCRLVYIGLRGEKIEGLEAEFEVFDKISRVSSGKFRRYHGESVLSHLLDIKTLLLNFRDFFKVIVGLFQALKILRIDRPDLVFSKGGFVAVPVGIAARLVGVAIITHDSDSVPGLANRILGRWAVIHATGMPTGNYKYPKETIHYVGIPVDERVKPVSESQRKDFKEQVGLPTDCQLLLVGGAGLGARDINNSILEIAPKLLSGNPSLHIVHLAGSEHQKEVGEKYSALLSEDQLPRVKIMGFTNEFYKYTGAADLVLTRAGATTIAELAVHRKATILIPAPFLTGGHQLENAKQLQKIHAAEVLPGDVSPEKLHNIIKTLLEDGNRRKSLEENIGKTARPDAAAKLAELLINVAKGEKGSV